MLLTSPLKTIIGLSVLLPYSAIAADSHVHGAANIYIVANQQQLMIELETPAANILGFEHAPKTVEQIQLLKSAKVILQNYANIVDFGDDINCKVQHVELESPFEDDKIAHADDSAHDSAHNGESGEHHAHDSSHSDEHHNESHDDEHHSKGYSEDHKSHDGHSQHEHHEENTAPSADSGHSDFHVTYELACETKPLIKEANITGFKTFPGLEKIHVHWVNGNKQGAFEATASNYSVEF